MSRTKRIVFAALAVALFFTLLELLLWAAGVETLLARRDPFLGFSRQVRVFEPDAARGVRATPARALAHSFNYQEFALDKSDGALRIFVLGGSSAFGFPWGAEVAFPKLVGEALRASTPDREVEVINAAAMSYGSHRLRILTHEVLEYAPDLIVVYSGHNEFVERRFYSEHLDRVPTLDGARRMLYRSRTYALMAQIYEGLARPAAPDGEPTDLLGLDVDREYSLEVGAREKAEVRLLFEENLRAIVATARAAGVPVVLCTVPSNVAGWVPNDSFFTDDVDLVTRSRVLAALEQGRSAGAEEAERLFTEARDAAPGYAESHFRLGQTQRALGNDSAARASFVAARDADGKPSRAPTELLDAIREVARNEDVPLVDVERIFESHAPGGLLGFNLFEDYVHPNPSGHRLIAWAVWSAILENGLGVAPQSPDPEVFRAAVGDPFAIGTDAESPQGVAGARTPNLLYNLAVVLENQGLAEQAIAKYRECLVLNPEYWLARENLARVLFQRARYVESATEYAVVVRQRPDRVEPLIGLGETLRRTGQAGQVERALQALEQATRIAPNSARAWGSLGGTLAQLNRSPAAEAAFRRAVELAPDDPENWVNLGLSLLFQKRLAEARVAFDTALAARPHDTRARNGVAAVLTEQGDLDEAERLFRENLALDPEDAFARGGLETIRVRRAGS